MQIDGLATDPALLRAYRGEIERLLDQPSDRAARPCPGCNLHCPKCGSISCSCNCSPACAEAPRMMSSEPEEFPIESAIVPLVYAFHSLRLTPPCWSCEGHYNRSGGLDVTFSIEPKICPTANPELKKLRGDSRIIAESLMTGLKAKSRLRVDCIDRVLGPSKPPRVS